MRHLTLSDILQIQALAGSRIAQIPANGHLPGMIRVLSPSEMLVAAMFDAILTVAGEDEIRIKIEWPDSDSIHDD